MPKPYRGPTPVDPRRLDPQRGPVERPGFSPRRGARALACLLGLASLAHALSSLLGQHPDLQWQVALGCALCAAAARLPTPEADALPSVVPSTVGLILLMLVAGPAAAVLGVVCVSVVRSHQQSDSPADGCLKACLASVAMLCLGTAFMAAGASLKLEGLPAMALMTLTAMAVVVGLDLLLARAMAWFTRGQGVARPQNPTAPASGRRVLQTNFLNAVVAGQLYALLQFSGPVVMLSAAITMAALLIQVYLNARRHAASQRMQTRLVQAAEREAAQSARHLEELRHSERRYHSAFWHAAIGMAIVTPEGLVLQVNPAMLALLNCESEELVGQDFKSFVRADDKPGLARHWARLTAQPQLSSDAKLELNCTGPDGSALVLALHISVFDEIVDSATCLILQAEDITSRRAAERRLRQIAYHDNLTSLLNRASFGACLEQALAAYQANPAQLFAVLYLGIK